MSFTTLYAELVVVGTGALIFILLFFYSFFGDWSWFNADSSWFSRFKDSSSLLENALILIPALSLIYLLGIVIANVSHHLFAWLEKRLQCSRLKEYAGSYAEIRNALYTDSAAKSLVGDFEFRRSKVRICRGWFLNCFLIIIALSVCAFNHKLGGNVAWFWILGTGLLMIGALVSWWTATTTELDWLGEYAKKLPDSTSAKK